MKKLSAFFVLSLLSILFLCAFKVEENTDKFDGTVTVSIKNPAKVKITKQRKLVLLEIVPVLIKNNDVITYSIHVTYYGLDWMLINAGPSLKMLIDGELKEYASLEDSNKALYAYQGFTETVWYDVKPEDLLKLSNAKKVEFRITGSRNTIEGEFRKEMLKEFSEFCKYCNIK
jgi:hypothetical protein